METDQATQPTIIANRPVNPIHSKVEELGLKSRKVQSLLKLLLLAIDSYRIGEKTDDIDPVIELGDLISLAFELQDEITGELHGDLEIEVRTLEDKNGND